LSQATLFQFQAFSPTLRLRKQSVSKCQIQSLLATSSISTTRLFISAIPIPPLQSRMFFEDREEDFDFCVEPKRAEFHADKGGASRHLMVNGTDHRIAIKIKCSNNLLYRIFPVYTCLDPGKAKRLQASSGTVK